MRTKADLDAYTTTDRPIQHGERDHQLALWTPDDAIANGVLTGWDRSPNSDGGHYLERRIWAITSSKRGAIYEANKKNLNRELKKAKAEPRELEPDDMINLMGSDVFLRERMLSFPSAPLLHKTVNVGRSLAHTMRIIDLPSRGRRPVDRIFLLHNGLDELLGFEFFYDFSASLLKEVERSGQHAACIIRPFPNHLSRFPTNPRFAATPLDDYLQDSSQLFRHYLRYMVEMQWLLSTLAPRDRYLSLSGSRLSGTRTRPGSGTRAKSSDLAKSMRSEFDTIREGSPEESLYETPDFKSFYRSVVALRRLLGITVSSDDKPPSAEAAQPPAIHTLGYSLGGFVAQSIFMTWPFVVASCGTICSGGALDELTPVAFAHPQEWQTLTHSLRYRLDDIMREVSPANKREHVLGLRPESFDYFKRVFYEVFEQHYRASYQTRISEYLQRVIFIVGGNDPVVRPKSVLDAAPAEGANLIEVGGLTHFVSSSKLSASKLETEQRDFWFPEIARLLARWAPETERVWRRSLRQGWRKTDDSGFALEAKYSLGISLVSDKERSAIGANGSVGTPIFERLVNAISLKVSDLKGFLFILRNEIPTFMLADEYHIYRAKALHHSEESIRDYLEGIRERRKLLESVGRGVIVVLPADAVSQLRNSFEPGLSPATSEVPVGEYLDTSFRTPEELVEYVCQDFESKWLNERSESMPGVWMFHPGEIDEFGKPLGERPGLLAEGVDLLGKTIDASKFVQQKAVQRLVSSGGSISVDRLPDCWMWLAPEECLDFVPTIEDWDGSSDFDTRKEAVDQLVKFTAMVVSDSELARRKRRAPSQWLNVDTARLILVSRARYNPRYRGRVISDSEEMTKLILHSSLALLRSTGV